MIFFEFVLYLMVFGFRAFGLKIRLDVIPGDEPAVGIGGIDGTCNKDFQFLMGKTLCFVNGAFKTDTFIEIVKTYMVGLNLR